MNHLTEEQLILHYYGEEGDTLAAEVHLDECEDCRALYGSLQRVLNVVDSMPIPTRSAEYGSQVWQRLESKLPAKRRPFWVLAPSWRWAAAGAAFAGMMIAAFTAGRFYPNHKPARKPATITASTTDPQAGERVLLMAVGDYLERSQMVLIELANASPKHSMDISSEQERAADLVSENRLYRQISDHNGDTTVSSILDDLDRVLLDIAHAPSQISARELEEFRQRLEAEGILFKIRLLNSNVRSQEEPARGVTTPAVRQRL